MKTKSFVLAPHQVNSGTGQTMINQWLAEQQLKITSVQLTEFNGDLIVILIYKPRLTPARNFVEVMSFSMATVNAYQIDTKVEAVQREKGEFHHIESIAFNGELVMVLQYSRVVPR
ncbi:MAG: hypothetical protein V4519_02760 [Patescibacteria group bacterium]